MTGFLGLSFIQGACLFFCLLSTGKLSFTFFTLFVSNVYSSLFCFLKLSIVYLSRQDSTLLVDIVDVGSLPSYTDRYKKVYYRKKKGKLAGEAVE